MMRVHLTRQSVAGGDDPCPMELELPAGTPLLEAVASVQGRRFLASIGGGEACWVVTLTGAPSEPGRWAPPTAVLAVLAQQWEVPRPVAAGDLPLAQLAGGADEMHWYVHYLAQLDPARVHAELTEAVEGDRVSVLDEIDKRRWTAAASAAAPTPAPRRRRWPWRRAR